METDTKIEIKENPSEIDPNQAKAHPSKPSLSTKHDPKVRMSYVVPEEIYPENIDL